MECGENKMTLSALHCVAQTKGQEMKAASKALNWLGLAVVAAAIIGAFSFGALGVYLLVLLQS